MTSHSLWLAQGLRTPFAKVDGPLAGRDAIALSVPLVQTMTATVKPDLMVWGTVAPNLHWSNIAREIARDAGLSPYIPSFTVVMACAPAWSVSSSPPKRWQNSRDHWHSLAASRA